MRILVIAAHPDDEVLGCGGAIAKLIKQGNEVAVAIFGEGITARARHREAADQTLVSKLRECSRRAVEVLGTENLSTYDFPDNRFDTVPLLDIVKVVEELVDSIMPEVIYSHHTGDLNVDHSILARAVMTGTRPLPGARPSELYAFEIPSSTDWAFHQLQPSFRPNSFVDITDQLEIKMKAMSQYSDELRAFPHPRSDQGLRVVARRWGSVTGVEYAEAFELVRSLR